MEGEEERGEREERVWREGRECEWTSEVERDYSPCECLLRGWEDRMVPSLLDLPVLAHALLLL